MCHVSVGHAARLIEEAGLPTVTVMTRPFGFRAEGMKVPRTVITRHPMGRPLGAPHDAPRQRQVLRAALDLLGSATANPTVVELPELYRPKVLKLTSED